MTTGAVEGLGRASLVASSVVSSWLVPALLFIVVILACWLGLRWIRSEHVETLRTVPLFSGLTRKRLMVILRSAHEVDFPPGGHIVEEGSRAGGLFVIAEGEATVSAGSTELARLGPGGYFGEMSVIDGGPRSATIKAATPVNTLELTPSAFKALLRKEPSIEESIGVELRRRLGDRGTAGGGATLEELCQQLRQAQQPDWAQNSSIPRRGLRRLLAPRASG